MHLKHSLSLLASLVMLGTACGPEAQLYDEDLATSSMTYQQFLSVIVHEPGTENYIVNGDELVEGEKNLREFYEKYVRSGQLIVNTVGGADDKWSATAKKNITYCVSSSSFGSNYNMVVSAMATATGAWEAAGDVDFIHLSQYDSNCTASQTGVVFDVRQVSGQGYLARAFFPSNSRSSRNVLIDTSAYSTTDSWSLEGILRHELGHTLGFRHEHTRPEAATCFEDNNWRSLTTYDSASVMHYPHCNGSNTGDLVLTQKDKDGTVALYGAPGGGGGTGTTTENFSGSVAAGENDYFGPFSVKAGTTFSVTMSGSGDPDLYVRFGAQPTTSAYDCRPYLSGASESCNLTVPSGQSTAYIMVRGYSSGSYSLTVTYTKPATGGGTPTTATASGSVLANEEDRFGPYSVVAGTQFKVVMTGSGDPDLYVRWGASPTTTSYNCRPYLNGASETCDLTVPAGTTSAYIMVRGYTSASYSLTINYTKP